MEGLGRMYLGFIEEFDGDTDCGGEFPHYWTVSWNSIDWGKADAFVQDAGECGGFWIGFLKRESGWAREKMDEIGIRIFCRTKTSTQNVPAGGGFSPRPAPSSLKLQSGPRVMPLQFMFVFRYPSSRSPHDSRFELGQSNHG